MNIVTKREKMLILIGYENGYEDGHEDSLGGGYCDAHNSGEEWLEGALKDGTISDFLDTILEVSDE